MTTKLTDAEIAELMDAVTNPAGGTLAQWAERFVPVGGREDVLRAINAVPRLVAEVRASRAAGSSSPRNDSAREALSLVLNSYDESGQKFIGSAELRAARAIFAGAAGSSSPLPEPRAEGHEDDPGAKVPCSCADGTEVSALYGWDVIGEAIHTPAACFHVSLFGGRDGEKWMIECGELTEKALARAREEGRREGIEEAAKVADGWEAQYPPDVFPPDSESREARAGTAMRHVAKMIARDVRGLSSRSGGGGEG